MRIESWKYGIPDGEWKYFYENKNKKAFGEISKGNRTGYWKYYFENEYLHIKSPFHNLKIDIQSITKIEKTSNLFSSPAPSIFGRVEVYYQNNSIVISPRNFDEFKNELLKMNPNIIVKE